MNLYKKNQYRYTEYLVERSEIQRKDIEDYLEETPEGKMYLITEPALYALKDARDTFKPYKTLRQITRDALQLFVGITWVATGLMMLLVVPFMLVKSFVDAFTKPRTLLPALFKALVFTPLEATIVIVRGALQIVTAPLTLLRMPLRALINYFSGAKKIEDNTGIKTLVAEAKKMKEANMSDDSTALINYTIRMKCIKAFKQGQSTAHPDVLNALENAGPKPKINEVKIYWQQFLPQPQKAVATASEETTTLENQEGGESLNSTTSAQDSPSHSNKM